jgi:hypothetical protein
VKANEAYRPGFLVDALGGWNKLARACRKHDTDRGLEFLVGGLASDRYVDNNDASVVVDCKTGALIVAAAKKIIQAELKKLGVTL